MSDRHVCSPLSIPAASTSSSPTGSRYRFDVRGNRRLGLLEPVQHPERVAVVVADRAERRVAPVPPPDPVPPAAGSLVAVGDLRRRLRR
jgi:hypothetical protein